MKKLFFCALLLSLFACKTVGTYKNGIFVKGSVTYRIANPGQGWKSVKERDADLAWYFERDGSTILVNSNCEIEDAPLKALTVHLLIGMTDQNIIEQKSVSWSGREALETQIQVKIDGVPRTLQVFVLKKDNCVYDIILASPPETFKERLLDYQSLLNQFDVEARKR